MKSPFWQKHVYHFVFIGCGLFVLLTVAAMFTYPGGIIIDETTEGYDFFRNFFSDLGLVTALNGESNHISMFLFMIALTLAGIGLILFFIAFRDLLTGNRTVNLPSLLGTVLGVASGLCFVIIAFAPYDVHFEIHTQTVIWAFRTFLPAVVIYTYIIFRQDIYPRHSGWIFVTFAISLAIYLYLLEFGPSPDAPNGLILHATVQKIVTYVSIFSVMAQSWLAYRIRSAVYNQ